MWFTYWFEVIDEESDLCGEEFFTELPDAMKAAHIAYAKSIFPGVKLHCLGAVSEYEAEVMGLDTY